MAKTKKTTSRATNDRMGNEIPATPDIDRLVARAIRDSVRDRDALTNVLSDLTPSKLVDIFRDADSGYIGPQIELAETIEERETQVQSLLGTRITAVKKLDWIIEPGDDSDRAREAADAFRAAWDQLNQPRLFDDLLKALMNQWAIVQVFWDRDGSRWTPVRTEPVDCRKLMWPQTDQPSTGSGQGTSTGSARGEEDGPTVASPRLAIDWNMQDTIPITAGSFITHTHRDVRGRPGRGAPIRAIAFWWMIKRFAGIDFATFVEQFGKPWKAVKYDPQASTQQVQDVLKVIKLAASDMGIAIPKSAELELINGMASGSEAPHVALIRMCDDNIAKAIIGSTTINDAAANNDSVSSPTHAGVRIDLRDADAINLAASIRQDLAVPFTLWNFGPGVAAPKIAPNLEEKPEPSSRAPIYEAAGRLGLPVKAEQIYSELGLERPEDVPDVITLGNGSTLLAASDQPAKPAEDLKSQISEQAKQDEEVPTDHTDDTDVKKTADSSSAQSAKSADKNSSDSDPKGGAK